MKEEQILTRIRSIVSGEGANPTALAQRWGIDTSSFAKQLRGERGVSLATVRAILDARPDISPDWLLHGVGTPLRGDSRQSPSPSLPLRGGGTPLDRDSVPRRRDGTPLDGDGTPPNVLPPLRGRDGVGLGLVSLPIVPFGAAAGYGADGESQACMFSECERCIMPQKMAGGATLMIGVEGDSMLPTLIDGDTVLARPMRSRTDLNWGRIYVLDTTRGSYVKRLLPAPNGCITCRSDNPRYADFRLYPDELRAAYQVTAVLHRL